MGILGRETDQLVVGFEGVFEFEGYLEISLYFKR